MYKILITKPVAIQKLLREFILAKIPVDYNSIERSLGVDDANTQSAIAVYNAHDPNPSPAELAAIARKASARINAKAIPNWVSWDEAQALVWGNANIQIPLTNARTSLAGMNTLTLTTFKAAMTLILNILDQMWVLQQANTRMTLAFRDEIWEDLQDK